MKKAVLFLLFLISTLQLSAAVGNGFVTVYKTDGTVDSIEVHGLYSITHSRFDLQNKAHEDYVTMVISTEGKVWKYPIRDVLQVMMPEPKEVLNLFGGLWKDDSNKRRVYFDGTFPYKPGTKITYRWEYRDSIYIKMTDHEPVYKTPLDSMTKDSTYAWFDTVKVHAKMEPIYIYYPGQDAPAWNKVRIARHQSQEKVNSTFHIGHSGDCATADAQPVDPTGEDPEKKDIYTFNLEHHPAFFTFLTHNPRVPSVKVDSVVMIANKPISGVFEFDRNGIHLDKYDEGTLSDTITLATPFFEDTGWKHTPRSLEHSQDSTAAYMVVAPQKDIKFDLIFHVRDTLSLIDTVYVRSYHLSELRPNTFYTVDAQIPDTLFSIVDLGLGDIKYAFRNVEAYFERGPVSYYGGAFAYGESTTKNSYDVGGQSHTNMVAKAIKQEFVPRTSADKEGAGDAAFQRWGMKNNNVVGCWRLPQNSEIDTLLKYCKTEWREYNGTEGALITGPSGKRIFLPVSDLSSNYWSVDRTKDINDFYYWIKDATWGAHIVYRKIPILGISKQRSDSTVFQNYTEFYQPGYARGVIEYSSYLKSNTDYDGSLMLLRHIGEQESTRNKGDFTINGMVRSARPWPKASTVVQLQETGFIFGTDSATLYYNKDRDVEWNDTLFKSIGYDQTNANFDNNIHVKITAANNVGVSPFVDVNNQEPSNISVELSGKYFLGYLDKEKKYFVREYFRMWNKVTGEYDYYYASKATQIKGFFPHTDSIKWVVNEKEATINGYVVGVSTEVAGKVGFVVQEFDKKDDFFEKRTYNDTGVEEQAWFSPADSIYKNLTIKNSKLILADNGVNANGAIRPDMTFSAKLPDLKKKYYFVRAVFATFNKDKNGLVTDTTFAYAPEVTVMQPLDTIDLGTGVGVDTRWASLNVEAQYPEDHDSTYVWNSGPGLEDPVITEIGGTTHDIAFRKWYGEDGWLFTMPSKEQMEEMLQNCDFTCMERFGQYVLKIDGPNGDYMFVPTKHVTNWNGHFDYKDIWTSKRDGTQAYYNGDGKGLGLYDITNKLRVRPVLQTNGQLADGSLLFIQTDTMSRSTVNRGVMTFWGRSLGITPEIKENYTITRGFVIHDYKGGVLSDNPCGIMPDTTTLTGQPNEGRFNGLYSVPLSKGVRDTLRSDKDYWYRAYIIYKKNGTDNQEIFYGVPKKLSPLTIEIDSIFWEVHENKAILGCKTDGTIFIRNPKLEKLVLDSGDLDLESETETEEIKGTKLGFIVGDSANITFANYETLWEYQYKEDEVITDSTYRVQMNVPKDTVYWVRAYVVSDGMIRYSAARQFGLDYVDLGLPSKRLWANISVGAGYPEDDHDYFSLGEPTNKRSAQYDYNSHKWTATGEEHYCYETYVVDTLRYYRCNPTSETYVDHLMTDSRKIITLNVPNSGGGRTYEVPYRGAIRELSNCSSYDGNIYWKHFSGTKNDAAYMNWQNGNPLFTDKEKYISNDQYGDLFVEPNTEEWKELQEVCGWKKETVFGVPGWRVTGPNGNTLFLPFKGHKWSSFSHRNDKDGHRIEWEDGITNRDSRGFYQVADSIMMVKLTPDGKGFDAPGDYSDLSWGEFYHGFGVRPIARYNLPLTKGADKLRDDTLAYLKTDTVTYVNYRTAVSLQGTYRINYPMASDAYDLGFVISDCTDAEKNNITKDNCAFKVAQQLRNASQYFVVLDNSLENNGKKLESDKTYFYRFFLHTKKDDKYYYADADSFHLADHYTKDVKWQMYATQATINGLVQGIMPAEASSAGFKAGLIVSYKRDLKATDNDKLADFDLTNQLQNFDGSKGGPIQTTFTLPKDTTYYYRLYVYYNGKYHYGDVNLFGYELVDLGLPSGKKWASINVGGSNPLQGMSRGALNESWGIGQNNMPYRTAGSGSRGVKGSGDPEDWAQTRWHNVYRMPYGSEAQELIDNCTWSADTIFGQPGVRATGANGKSIFFRHSQKYYQGNALKESNVDYSLDYNYMIIPKSNETASDRQKPSLGAVYNHSHGCNGVDFERPIWESNIILNNEQKDELLIRTNDAQIHSQVDYVSFWGTFIGATQQRWGESPYNVDNYGNDGHYIKCAGFIIGSDSLVTHLGEGRYFQKYDFPQNGIHNDSILFNARKNINLFKVDTTYWVRAYVKIGEEYYYGRSIKFVRQPNIVTGDVTWAVGKTTAKLQGSVIGFNSDDNIGDGQQEGEFHDMEELAKKARVGIVVGFRDDLGPDVPAAVVNAVTASEEVLPGVFRKKVIYEGDSTYFYDLGHAVNGSFEVTVPYDQDTTYFYRAFIYYNDHYLFGKHTNHYGLRFVDLGLPMKWASINVGSRFAEDDSHQYSWGDTIANNNGRAFTFENYPYYYSTGDDEYNNLGNEIKGSKHDVAHLRWNYTWDTNTYGGRGALWSMPSEEDLQMLVDSCVWEKFSSKGNFGEYVSGYKVKSKKTGDSIFVSAAACTEYTISGYHDRYGPFDYGPLWTSSRAPRERNAYGIQVGASNDVDAKRLMKYHYRYHGHFVRPMAHINVNLPTGRKLSIMTERTNWVAGAKAATIYGCVLGLTNEVKGTYGFVVGASDKNLVMGGAGVETYTIQTNTSQLGLFSKTLTPLDNNRMYYFRAFLTVNGKTYYGEVKEFGIVMVDLGLQSGTKWANVNMGAWKQKDHGDYYAWGETTTKDIFTLDGYKYYTSQTGNFRDLGNNISGNDTTDVANKMLGGRWRMAGDEEWNELITKCTWTPDTMSHIPGYRVTGPNGNSIFLPANYYNPKERDANYDLETNEDGSSPNNHDNEVAHRGYYWSSNRSSDYKKAREVLFIDSVNGRSVQGAFNESYRYRGNSIRPVASTNRADRFYMRTDATDWRYKNDSVSFYAVILFDENKLPEGYEAGFLISQTPNATYSTELIQNKTIEAIDAHPSTIGSGDYVAVYRGEYQGNGQWAGNKHNDGTWYYRAYVTDGHEYWYGDSKQFGFDPVNMDQGLSWANINVDAASPEEIGLNGTPIGKYYGKDPAYAEFGGLWHIPSDAEKAQLLDEEHYEWRDTTIYGTKVYKVISKAEPTHFIYLNSTDPSEWGMRAISQSNLTFVDTKTAYLRTDSTNWRAGYADNRLFATLICNPDSPEDINERGFFVGTTPNVTRESSDWLMTCVADSINTSDYAAKMGNLPIGTYYYRAYIRYKNADYVVDPSDAKEVGIDFVDLGLNSGVKWANVNIGSTVASDTGDNYAWGDTNKRSTYTQQNYPYYNPNTGYADIGADISANTKYDVAALKIEDTRMPTQADLDELLTLIWTEETLNGVKGFRVTAINGHSIFLPQGDYWTATQNSGNNSQAYELTEYVRQNQTTLSKEKQAALRYLGKMVRPVQSAVITLDATDRTTTTAKLNGRITVDSYTERGFEYSRTVTAGSLVGATIVTVTGSGAGTFETALTDLTPGALYYYRAYVTINNTKYYGAIKNFSTKSENTMQAIDLGLSVKWADRNVGALLPENDGDFYAWGDLLTRNMYSTTTYTHNVNNSYVDIGTNISATEWDISTKNFGGCWRMPTKAEMDELLNANKCTWTWATKEGVPGYWVESKPALNAPQQVIFMPAAGYHELTYYHDNDTKGHYWTSTVGGSTTSSTAYALDFSSTSHVTTTDGSIRYYGYTIRPVYDSNGSVDGKDIFIRTDSVSYAGDRTSNTLYGSMLGLNSADDGLTQGFVIGVDQSIVRQDDTTSGTKAFIDVNQTATANGSYHIALTDEQLQSLTVGDVYYVRAYVSKNGDTKYGDAVEMTDYTFFTDSVKWGLGNEGKLYGHIKAQKPASGLEIGFLYATKSDMSDAKSVTATFETGDRANVFVGTIDTVKVATYYYQAYTKYEGVIHKGAIKSFGAKVVDLGLTSGVKWVDMNMGADDEEAPGDNYRWGETAPNLTGAYNVPADRTYIGGTGYDAAHTRLGGDYRLPSVSNIQELADECNWAWDVNGFRVTSKKNGNSIFLPISSAGGYWSSQQGNAAAGSASMLEMSTTNRQLAEALRDSGLLLRPTLNPKSDMNGEGGNAGSAENGSGDVEGTE